MKTGRLASSSWSGLRSFCTTRLPALPPIAPIAPLKLTANSNSHSFRQDDNGLRKKWSAANASERALMATRVSEKALRLRQYADRKMVERWELEARAHARAMRPPSIAKGIWVTLPSVHEAKPKSKKER